jgi:hypothetical protein
LSSSLSSGLSSGLGAGPAVGLALDSHQRFDSSAGQQSANAS